MCMWSISSILIISCGVLHPLIPKCHAKFQITKQARGEIQENINVVFALVVKQRPLKMKVKMLVNTCEVLQRLTWCTEKTTGRDKQNAM